MLAFAAARVSAQEIPIDTSRSTIVIHVGKAGLLSAAGHEHWINAPISSGSIDESALRVNFRIEAAKMTVRPDPKVDAKAQGQIQKDMEGQTLEAAKYPEISFQSAKITKISEAEWKVDGSLSLHGVTKPITISVKRSGDGYAAHTILKQTDYGIKPASAGGGTIRVKNEIDLDFQIFARK